MKRSQNVLIPRMRKSRVAGVKSLSVAIASVIAAGCSVKEEVHIFKSVNECSASNKFSVGQCETAYQKALAEAQKTAPRYTSLRDCEYEFGAEQCLEQKSRSSAGSFFMPLMAGFMVSEAFRRNSHSSGYYYNPLFSHYDNGYSTHRSPVWTTSDGRTVAKGNKKSASVSKSALKPKPKVTKTMSRGGFGSTASAKSSWGSSSKSKGGWGG